MRPRFVSRPRLRDPIYNVGVPFSWKVTPLREPQKHGTLRGYACGCRCEACRVVKRAYDREYRRRQKEKSES